MLHDAFTLGLLRLGAGGFGDSPATYTPGWPNVIRVSDKSESDPSFGSAMRPPRGVPLCRVEQRIDAKPGDSRDLPQRFREFLSRLVIDAAREFAQDAGAIKTFHGHDEGKAEALDVGGVE